MSKFSITIALIKSFVVLVYGIAFFDFIFSLPAWLGISLLIVQTLVVGICIDVVVNQKKKKSAELTRESTQMFTTGSIFRR
jgi:uncharacterized membrane protein YhdT